MTDWRVAYISALGGKATPAALSFLSKWQPWEGGHTNNSARYNYMNTTLRMPGSTPINSVGVQSYGSLAQGARAFAKTLLAMPEYAPLVNFIKTGQGDPTPGLEMWVSGKTNGNPSYAAKILGSHAGAITPGAPVAPSPTTPSASSPAPGAPGVPGVPAPTAASQAAQIRQQALSGFGDIATGAKSATQSFGDMAGLLKTLKATVPTLGPSLSVPEKAAPSSLEGQAASLVRKYLGVKYTWGGTKASTGFDCSGLVQTVWKQMGVNIPRTSQEQWKFGNAVPMARLKPGDTVFFVGSDGTASAPGHEGMYIGNGKYIAAPHTGAVVSVFNLADSKDYVGARSFA